MMTKSIEEILMSLDEKFLLEINKLVLKYAGNKQLINQNYMNQLVSLFIKEYHLEKYLHSAKLVNDSNVSSEESASYSFMLKRITIQLEHFLKEVSYLSDIFKFSANDKVYLIYTYFNKILFHEIAHSYQLLEIKEGNNFDAKILGDTFKKTTYLEYLNFYLPDKIRELSPKLTSIYKEYVKRVKLYYHYYPCVPEERLAEYFANDLSLTLIERLRKSEHIDNLEEFYRYVLLRDLLVGYDISLNPTLFYLEKFGKKIELPSIYSNPLDVRLKYGLEITKKEYDSLVKIKKAMYKKLR